MSERFSNKPEIHSAPEMISDYQTEESLNEKSYEQQDISQNKIDIDQIRTNILAEPPVLIALPYDETAEGSQPEYIDKTMKKNTLKNELTIIRHNLPLNQRILSMTIHQPLIKKASDISANTITRPIGLLGGGIFAFVGSLIYLMADQYIGLKYNYLFFLLFFVFGYIFAILLELASKPFIRHKD